MVGFLRFSVVGLLSFSVLAVEAAPRQKPVVRPASTQDQFKKGSTTLDIDRHWGEVVDIPASEYSSSARVNLPVVQKSKYSPGRIATGIKNVLKNNPIKLAVTTAGVYLIQQLPGASFDSVTGEPIVTTEGEPMPRGEAAGDYYWRAEASPYPIAGSVEATCRAYVATKTSAQGYRSHTVSESGGVCVWGPTTMPHIVNYTNITRVGSHCPTGGTYKASLGVCLGVVVNPMTDAQIDQVVSNTGNLSEQQWAELGPELLAEIPGTFDGPDGSEFTGPASVQGSPTVTTSTDSGTGTTTVTESIPSFTFDYSADPLSITSNTTVTNNTYENGVQTSTSTTVQTSPSTGVETVPEIEVPTDCDFMPTVCSFIDWVKDPFQEEEPDLSDLIADDDFQKNIDFSSNASCPAPSIMATSQGSFEFSWQPACQWAGMVKPFIIIAALLAAIFINLGAIRGPN